MKVILLENIEKLGKKYEVKEVKAGYARNFLFANNLAKPATKQAIEWLNMQKDIESKVNEEELKKAQDFASSLDGIELIIPVKLGKENQLFESINTQKISEKLKETGVNIKKSQIELEAPIKELGEYPIKIKLDHNLESEIRVIVIEEK